MSNPPCAASVQPLARVGRGLRDGSVCCHPHATVFAVQGGLVSALAGALWLDGRLAKVEKGQEAVHTGQARLEKKLEAEFAELRRLLAPLASVQAVQQEQSQTLQRLLDAALARVR